MDTPIPAELVADAPAFADELDEAIMLGVEVMPESAQRFAIETVGQAEWAMRKLSVLEQREAAVGVQADEWREKINEWERGELKRLEPSAAYFTGLLEHYALVVRTELERATLPLPSGDIGTRKPRQPTIEIVDDSAALAWCADNLPGDEYDAVVKTEPKLRVTEFRKILTAQVVDTGFCQVCGASIADHLVEAGAEGAPDHKYDPVTEYRVMWQRGKKPSTNDVPVSGVRAFMGDTVPFARPR